MNEDNESDDERRFRYANDFLYFFRALRLLSLEALEQCENMGYYNVAWELRDDFLRNARTVLNSPEGQLSSDAKVRLSELIALLDTAPPRMLRVDNFREKHIESMHDPFWAPIRSKAEELMPLLSGETERTDSILWPNGRE